MSERVLPFYVVCDESYSMREHLDELNRGLRELHHAIGTDPVAAGMTRFCLIGFSSSAEILLPLSRLNHVTEFTQLRVKAASRFGAVLTVLRETIERDVDLLESDGHAVCRPAVFFLSDGQPTDPDDWLIAHEWFMDPSWPGRPHVVALGIGDADASVIGRIGTFRAFLSTPDDRGVTALRGLCRALTASMAQSGTSVAEGCADSDGALLVPGRMAGFTPLTAGSS